MEITNKKSNFHKFLTLLWSNKIISKKPKNLDLIEIDKDLLVGLRNTFSSYKYINIINANILKYDLKIQFDDDSWFHKYPNISLDNILNDKKKEIFTGNTFSYNYEKAKETTEQLFETVKIFCKKYNITPKNELLRTAIEKNNEKLFEYLQ